ncbi:hypothetical protein GCM10009665_46660 [Kitasatospora nipponensis]|uniref:Uncharacterized protein n=1 Tax=Kitasatospora nipponensis TaxID=258049 RepID=A0ABN1WK90_9ACTN
MPSLRQPVGPLPASIYWRRRVVVFAALAVLVAVVAWLTVGQGGGDKQKTAQPVPSPSAASSITPGAPPTGPAISTHPGGSSGGTGSGGSTAGTSGAANGAAGGSGTTGGGTAGASGATTGGDANGGTTGTAGGATTGGSGTGGTATGATTGGSGGTGGTGGATGGAGAPPINTGEVMALPVCTASQLTLELAGTQNAYQPKDRPTFELKVRNASGSPCRVDLSQAAAAITVNSASGERIWSSADCVADKRGRWVQVSPATALTETFVWERTRSKPQCATPTDTTAVPAGNYLVQAELTGPSGGPVPARTSTRLDG